jgi:hypothetical protein
MLNSRKQCFHRFYNVSSSRTHAVALHFLKIGTITSIYYSVTNTATLRTLQLTDVFASVKLAAYSKELCRLLYNAIPKKESDNTSRRIINEFLKLTLLTRKLTSSIFISSNKTETMIYFNDLCMTNWLIDNYFTLLLRYPWPILKCYSEIFLNLYTKPWKSIRTSSHQNGFEPSTMESHNIGLDFRWLLSSRFLTTRILSLNRHPRQHPWRYFCTLFLSLQILNERK